MKFGELIDGLDQPQSGEQMLNVLKTILMADDMSRDERGAVACGFIIGASFVLAKHTEGRLVEACESVMQMMVEFDRTIFQGDT